MSDYWLGFVTPFLLAGAGLITYWAGSFVASVLRPKGWFIETGKAPKTEVSAWSNLQVRGRFGIHVGLYRTTSGWGSRWVAIGPVSVGRKSWALALTEPPAIEDRTEPPPGSSWRWSGNPGRKSE